MLKDLSLLGLNIMYEYGIKKAYELIKLLNEKYFKNSFVSYDKILANQKKKCIIGAKQRERF